VLKTYEALFIFSSSLDDAGLDKLVGRISGEITKLGGQVDQRRVLGKRAFARPQKKWSSGLYVALNFRIETGKMQALKARFKLIEDIFRVQILRKEERKAVEAAAPAAEAAPAAAATEAAAHG
jgi:ribosomal protein S6